MPGPIFVLIAQGLPDAINALPTPFLLSSLTDCLLRAANPVLHHEFDQLCQELA